MKDIAEYKIGDEIFRYVTVMGVFRWLVIGRRERENEVQLELECQTCNHGWKCKVLVAQNDYKKIVSVNMLNEDDEDSQRHFHGQEECTFWPTSAEAKNEHLKNLIRKAEKELSDARELVGHREKRLSELRGLIEDVQP